MPIYPLPLFKYVNFDVCICHHTKLTRPRPWPTWPRTTSTLTPSLANMATASTTVPSSLLCVMPWRCAIRSMFGWWLGGRMRREIRYPFISYAFDLDLPICVSCSSLYPTSRSFPKRIYPPTLSKANFTTLLHPYVALVNVVFLGWRWGQIIAMRNDAYQRCLKCMCPCVAVCCQPLLQTSAPTMHAAVRSLVSLHFVSQPPTY